MSLGNALGYLTVLPIPYKKHVPLIRSIHYFPFVGAGMGSIAVLFFIASRHVLPDVLSCFLAVAALEAMGGGSSLRGLAEMAQGRQTFPGHGFDSGFKLEKRGLAIATIVVILKVSALAVLPREWQTRAVFILPVLGRCAQVLVFILSPHRLPEAFAGDPAIARRRVRAGFLSLALLLLLFLFPWRVALPALAVFAAVAGLGLKYCNKRFQGLTLQTVALISEMGETSVLLCLAAMARGQLR